MELHDVLRVDLRYHTDFPKIMIREITGQDEMYVRDTRPATAIGLINNLIVQADQLTEKSRAEKITTADRDHILVAIYQNNYGNKIEGTLTCKACAKLYEMDFSLPDLVQYLTAEERDTNFSNGIYLEDGFSFRLPTGEDELAIEGLTREKAVDELLNRCIVKGEKEQAEKIQAAMAKIAPVLQTEMQTNCPECGAEQLARFDIQSYLLGKLKQEQKSTIRDVHRLASAYKWTHHEILGLPRRLRRMYVSLVESEMIQ